jgi:hypothetical protein
MALNDTSRSAALSAVWNLNNTEHTGDSAQAQGAAAAAAARWSARGACRGSAGGALELELELAAELAAGGFFRVSSAAAAAGGRRSGRSPPAILNSLGTLGGNEEAHVTYNAPELRRFPRALVESELAGWAVA